MGFMIAYNQFSSSRPTCAPTPSREPHYRGSAGGLGRKGAARLVIFETDGLPNTRAYATLTGSGSDSYYPIRINEPGEHDERENIEWPDDRQLRTTPRSSPSSSRSAPWTRPARRASRHAQAGPGPLHRLRVDLRPGQRRHGQTTP